MQTLRVCGRNQEEWIDLMPVERFAQSEHDTKPDLSLCFARVSAANDDANHLWVTNGELIKGEVVDCNGALVDHRGLFDWRNPPLLMDAFLHLKGLPNKRNLFFGVNQREWPRQLSLEMMARIEGAPTPQMGVVLRMAFPAAPPVPVTSVRFDPRARAAGAPAFVEFAFSLFSAP